MSIQNYLNPISCMCWINFCKNFMYLKYWVFNVQLQSVGKVLEAAPVLMLFVAQLRNNKL